MDPLARVIVGNVVIYPATLRQFLKKSHYFMTYHPDTERITFEANHWYGGVILFEIRNASHENAQKLATELGLASDSPKSCHWGKYNPVLNLQHNGSPEAEQLRVEMLRLSVPFVVVKTDGTEPFALTNGQGMHKSPMWNVESMLKIIRDTAERHKDQLATTP